jgi:Uncharacterised nucleotidyltransferase
MISPRTPNVRSLEGTRASEGPTQQGTFREVLTDAIEAMEQDNLSYLVMGGLGAATVGRPRQTHDIDLLVAPGAAGAALRALDRAGFRTQETDPRWLYKAFKHDVMVDIIFRSAGDIYLDDEMLRRSTITDVDGCAAPVTAPEDLIVIKAVAAAEHSPRHWYDALAIIASRDLDWSYLMLRARRHGLRRVLSLLLYASSLDVFVPLAPLRELFEIAHGA